MSTGLAAPACAGLMLAALWVPEQGRPSTAFPDRLDTYFRSTLKLTAEEVRALRAGTAVTRLIAADPAHEVAVVGAVWVAAPPDLYVRAVKDIEQLERGKHFRVTKKVSEPARIEDFAALILPQEDVDDLRRCKVGSCEIKLSQAALDKIRTQVDWSKPTAKADTEALFRQIAVDYVTAYRRGGNKELAVYRDGQRPTLVAQEFAEMVQAMPELGSGLSNVRRFLLEYPAYVPPRTSSFIYWQEASFGLKPTIRFNHLAVIEEDGGVVVMSKQLYASHYFWTALEMRVLVPDPSRGVGFWFVNVNRSRSDGLTGFVGRVIGGKVRSEAENGMKAVLAVTKQSLESQHAGKGTNR